MLFARREKFKHLSVKIGIAFSKLRLSPNQWTIISIIPALIAAYYLSINAFLAAAVMFIIAGFLDMVDGSVARVTGHATTKGAYLDTIVDRYIEFIIILGLLFAVLPQFIFPAYAWIFLYLFGGMMTTYSKAAAKEKLDIEVKGGILERAERLLILFIGLLLAVYSPIYLTYILALLAVLANISAIQRIARAWRIAKTY